MSHRNLWVGFTCMHDVTTILVILSCFTGFSAISYSVLQNYYVNYIQWSISSPLSLTLKFVIHKSLFELNGYSIETKGNQEKKKCCGLSILFFVLKCVLHFRNGKGSYNSLASNQLMALCSNFYLISYDMRITIRQKVPMYHIH